MLAVERGVPTLSDPDLTDYLYRFEGGTWLMHPVDGPPHMMILFPSQYACRVWKQRPETPLEVEIFDRMWLPFHATRAEAQKEAAWWGYQTKPIGDDAFELDSVWNDLPDRAIVRFDNEKARMVDVIYVLDTPEAVDAVTTIRTRLLETEEPPEARILFQWSDDMGIIPITHGIE